MVFCHSNRKITKIETFCPEMESFLVTSRKTRALDMKRTCMTSEGLGTVGWHLRPYLQPGFMAWEEMELLAQVPQVFCQALFLLLLELPVLLAGP